MNFKKASQLFLNILPAPISGILLTLSFPNAQLWPVAFVAFVPLLITLKERSSKVAFYSGFFTGFIHFTSLIYWLVPTLKHYGGLNLFISVLALILLCAYLSLYFAVFCLILKKANFIPLISPVMAACLWICLEYMRTYAFTGFSWGAIGYSQYLNLPLAQIADFSGVYGVSFVLMVSNSAITEFWTYLKNKQPKKGVLQLLLPFLIVGSALIYGHYKLSFIRTVIHSAPQTKIGIIQGNIEQDFKWSKEYKLKTINKYIALSTKLLANNPELIVWPETALPFYYGRNKPLSLKVDMFVRSSQTHFLIGSPAYELSGREPEFYNRAYMLSPDATVTGSWDKSHLVPFGEYVPFGNYLKFLGKIIEQAGDYSAGKPVFIPLDFNHHKTGVLICFEILFPSISSNFVKNGATYLTTMTNDAWFGNTSAPGQHFAIAVFRAIENRRSLIRAANTGISGFIEPTGKIVTPTSLFTDQAIITETPALEIISFYTRCQDKFTWAAGLAFLLVFMLKSLKKSARRTKK